MNSAPLPLGYQLYNFDVTTSTMDEAQRFAQQGEPEKTLVMATRQTKGRGRRGRIWSSDPGNFHLSIIFRPKSTLNLCVAYSFILCLAAGYSLQKILPSSQKIFYKWPNDIVLLGSKIGGVLLEVETDVVTNVVKWLIGGVGINVAYAPSDADFPAISLRESGVLIQPQDLLFSFCLELQFLLTLWKAEGFTAIRALWLKQAYGLGSSLVVKGAGEILRGLFLDLDADGSLILKTDAGERKKILTGDVLFLNSEKLKESATGSP